MSDHQDGYGFVLAYISDIGSHSLVRRGFVPPFLRVFTILEVGIETESGNGSICTMSADACPNDFNNEVLPQPV